MPKFVFEGAGAVLGVTFTLFIGAVYAVLFEFSGVPDAELKGVEGNVGKFTTVGLDWPAPPPVPDPPTSPDPPVLL